MKKICFIVGVFLISYSVNASKAIVVEKEIINKEFSNLDQSVIMYGKEIKMVYEYCVSIGFTFCDGSCTEVTYCSPWSWQEAYAYIVRIQHAQEDYLETCD